MNPEGQQARGSLLTARNLNKYYGGLRALRDVDVDVRRGEILALVGDNGAGKSTLIKVLSGAIIPDEGEIRLKGEPVAFKRPTDARGRGIETVHQSLGLIDELDVPQNVFLGRELTKPVAGFFRALDKAEMRRRTRELLQNFSIGLPTLNEPVRRLSGGQRQTIAISRLLLSEPDLLIMDEPMAALGVDEGQKVLDLVVRLKAKGMTVLMISHNLEHVFSIADRIAVMKNGAMVGVVERSAVSRADIVSMITVGHA
ncbi:ATP-binding cassette domain-containing protein [Chelativorans sp. M5D2P16]|uniref:ATP-binding cassette domain-containing protein n=1 Tax=Chelativorans sp. M5D2P16 TaxID=3095678 RepID=UPI002ACAB2FE|nr:ATP-binding cassette domain-containing protein [Chelativorans sp. M5D2P16]MDZ5698514.1 ATP-binding cassette domain-containing protein [Chelativorans sp. M5D2P16]